ncbi:leucyl aminopeptidase [Nakamurella endophytica]|uniref:Probable cytosol aminopeptidase n=1 Tax=Nakamurella endophytica TaxID=1748367 RepID=A0A917T176_9ACTN|nr:leucyl aminopeptidase [Nakamurella endophytica]GGM06607.1 putative cytosol aminopeptidase [Nakamurella endophytica]
MTVLSLSATPVDEARADVVVIAAFAGDDGPVPADEAHGPLVERAATLGALGKADEVVLVDGSGLVRAPRVAVVGLGRRDRFEPDAVRRAAGAASRALAGHATVFSALSTLDLTAAAEGHLLGAYVFDRYKEPAKPPAQGIALLEPAGTQDAEALLRHAVVAAEAVAFARDLVNTAPNDLPPAAFAERAVAAATEAGLEVRVWDEERLRAEGFGGILAVGSGSVRPPRLVSIRYAPENATRSVALIGKGITFDSGGLSIKPAQGMEHMTSDMAGAAAVTATVLAAARLGLPVAVTAWAALAENLPSGSSYRPGDVLRHYGGTTVHVLNTDAEGRLVLADAIARAAEDAPDQLLETSTLTGAQVVALGNRTMGVMGEPGLRDRVAELARQVGEGGWAMPLPPELREGLESPLADMANVNWDRVGGMLVAGHYLSEFVPDGLPWAHLDVAGPAYNHAKTWGYTALGATGVPVRTLLAAVEDLARQDA